MEWSSRCVIGCCLAALNWEKMGFCNYLTVIAEFKLLSNCSVYRTDGGGGGSAGGFGEYEGLAVFQGKSFIYIKLRYHMTRAGDIGSILCV